ncbi:MAG: response regulator transcription factor [Chloroflexi bacterium]|uniref:Response regulator transcription factor n=1 Tax=Candidatus Chlorohelix allophototropha TaxID=3003348 RepID=A0A8T7M9Q2_9CHLR|nr:response regulator transcription factor [Chloroflexota bacterium]WJW68725.1 response regulator transcription factor [Chloroflexota bacterium L227-S17]
MTKKILVIEDEVEIGINLCYMLEAAGYEVISAQGGKHGIELARQFLPDLILSDIMMPDIDGYQVLESLRKDPATLAIPVIFLTAKSSHENIRQGMQLGVDDYICKPFTHSELLEAVKARLRRQNSLKASLLMPVSNELYAAANSIKNMLSRAQDEAQTPPVAANSDEPEPEPEAVVPVPPTSRFDFGELIIDFELRNISVNGHEVKLSPHQFNLLHYLVENAGKIVSHRNVLLKVWGPEYEKETQYLHVFISQLRQKIEPNPSNPRYILTERGFGYRFAEPTPIT